MTTEQKWAARVAAWRASGKSATAFAEGKEYSASGLRYWAWRLRQVQGESAPALNAKEPTKGAASASAPKEVRIARVLRAPEAAETETPIVLEVGAVRVGVRRGFDRGALRELLDVLGGRS
jgi:hypothetical protein